MIRALDACSQLLNVVVLGGDANESLSGRAYRQGWTEIEAAINALVFWEQDHCRRAFEADLERARVLIARYDR